jgi:hypothetical protein
MRISAEIAQGAIKNKTIKYIEKKGKVKFSTNL